MRLSCILLNTYFLVACSAKEHCLCIKRLVYIDKIVEIWVRSQLHTYKVSWLYLCSVTTLTNQSTERQTYSSWKSWKPTLRLSQHQLVVPRTTFFHNDANTVMQGENNTNHGVATGNKIVAIIFLINTLTDFYCSTSTVPFRTLWKQLPILTINLTPRLIRERTWWDALSSPFKIAQIKIVL